MPHSLGGLMSFLYLVVAIVAEVMSTKTLKPRHECTKPLSSVALVFGYSTSFSCDRMCLVTGEGGEAHAIWAGLGMVLVTLTAAAFHRQVPDRSAVVGISLIITGVLVLNLLSRNAPH